jgi:hypothetical protein
LTSINDALPPDAMLCGLHPTVMLSADDLIDGVSEGL